MDPKLRNLLPIIEQRLSQPDIDGFKIGKAEFSKKRFEEYADNGECYHFLSVVANGDSTKVNTEEIDMIDYFKFHSSVKCKCLNQNAGGGGNPKATELYFVAKLTGANCRDSLLLPPSPLFSFSPVQL